MEVAVAVAACYGRSPWPLAMTAGHRRGRWSLIVAVVVVVVVVMVVVVVVAVVIAVVMAVAASVAVEVIIVIEVAAEVTAQVTLEVAVAVVVEVGGGGASLLAAHRDCSPWSLAYCCST